MINIKNRCGLSLVEVIVALSILALGILYTVHSLLGTSVAIHENLVRDQARQTLTEAMTEHLASSNMPLIITGKSIMLEQYTNVSKIKTRFAPIDTNSVVVYYWNGSWEEASGFITTTSGTIDLQAEYDNVYINYDVLAWNYICDRRYNRVGNNIYLDFSEFAIKYVATDDGDDIYLGDIDIIDNERGIIQIDTHDNEWVNIYYRKPKVFICTFYRPDLRNYNLNNKTLTFVENLNGYRTYVCYEYNDISNNPRIAREFHVINDGNSITLDFIPIDIKHITSQTVLGIVDWPIYGRNEWHTISQKMLL